MVWVPALRCGQPAVLAENGVELELAALRQSLALIRFRLRSSAQPDGLGEENGYRGQKSGAEEARSASSARLPTVSHGCTRAQRTRPHEVPLHRPAGRGRG